MKIPSCQASNPTQVEALAVFPPQLGSPAKHKYKCCCSGIGVLSRRLSWKGLSLKMQSSVRGSPDVFQDVPRFLAWGLERTACANKLVNGVETIFVGMRKVIWWRLKKGHFRRGELRLIVIIFGTSWCLLWDSLNRRWYPQNSLLTRMSQNLAR